MIPGSSRNWLAVNAVQQSTWKNQNNMTTPPPKKSIVRSPLRLGFFLAPLAVACLALMPFAQSAQAVGPEPNEGDLIGNVSEEDDAVADLGGDMVEAAVGQAAETGNRQVIPFHFEKNLQCAGGKVTLDGKVVVTFKHTSLGVVQPHSLKLEGFRGTAKSGNRKLVAKKLRFTRAVSIEENVTGHKEGQFSFEFKVTGPGLPVAREPLIILVRYGCGEDFRPRDLRTPCSRPNRYIFEEGKVTKMIPDKPRVECSF
jgi:hypothetical protein